MARKKRKGTTKAVQEPPVKKKLEQINETAAIKRSLKSACKQPYDDNPSEKCKEKDRIMSPLRKEIERIVIEMTKTLKAGSLNVHVSLYHLFHHGTRTEIETEFKQNIGKNYQFFSDYFRGLSMIHGEVVGYKLNPTIRRLCLQYAVDPPNVESIGNIFNFSIQKYHVNFMNNICVHAYNRIRKFFYAQTRSKKRVYDTLHFLFHHESDKTPEPALIEALVQLRPINFNNNGAGYFHEMEKKWYQYVPLFMELQG